MEISLFLLGALGAFLTVYLARQEAIPEFRPFYDTTEKEKEADYHREHIKKTENEIDEIQALLKDKSLSADKERNLNAVLGSSQAERKDEIERLQGLEGDIKVGQILTRSFGFFAYIVLGGVFGGLLAGYVKIEGLSGDLPKAVESLAIGATWTAYLSTIGFSGMTKKYDEALESLAKKFNDKLESVKNEVAKSQAWEPEAGKQPSADKQPQYKAVSKEMAMPALIGRIDRLQLELKDDLKRGAKTAKRQLSSF